MARIKKYELERISVIERRTESKSRVNPGKVESVIFPSTVRVGLDAHGFRNGIEVQGKIYASGSISLSGSSYINWSKPEGESGYGIRDNSGTIQYKNISDQNWSNISAGGGASVWTDGGAFIYPTSDEIVILGGQNLADADIQLGSDGSAIFNKQSSEVDIQIKSSQATHMLFVDGTNNKIGIKNSTPTHALSVVGAVSASLGLSGSLTRLVDGTSYIVGGANITVTSQSNGAITLASTSGGGTMSSWNLAGDTGSTSISDGNTATVAGTAPISTTESGGTVSISLDNTAVTPNTYGDANNVAQIAVDQQGRITGVSNVTIAGGGGGGGSGDYQTKSSDFTATTSEYMFGISTQQGAVTGTLPACASAGAGKQYIFKDIGGFAGNTSKGIQMEPDSNTELIDGSLVANILVNSGTISVMTDGSNWFVIGTA
jgi:hypothetical protein